LTDVAAPDEQTADGPAQIQRATIAGYRRRRATGALDAAATIGEGKVRRRRRLGREIKHVRARRDEAVERTGRRAASTGVGASASSMRRPPASSDARRWM